MGFKIISFSYIPKRNVMIQFLCSGCCEVNSLKTKSLKVCFLSNEKVACQFPFFTFVHHYFIDLNDVAIILFVRNALLSKSKFCCIYCIRETSQWIQTSNQLTDFYTNEVVLVSLLLNLNRFFKFILPIIFISGLYFSARKEAKIRF